jgi:hypothetical protein
VITDLDIYRAANMLIDRHGAEALIEAARMIDRMLELGDAEGQALWQRILRRSKCCRRRGVGGCIKHRVNPSIG